MAKSNVSEEIKDCTLEELELIYDTQKDLYTKDEMRVISDRIVALGGKVKKEKSEVTAAAGHLEVSDPQTVSRCAAENMSYGMHYLFSVLVPLVGFIMGGIFMTKENPAQIRAGRNCIWFAFASMIVGTILFMQFIQNIF